MKTKTTVFMMITLFLFLGGGIGCEGEDESEYSALVEGYVVGSFICNEVGSEGQVTRNQTPQGYCILLEGSKNTGSLWPMDFYTSNLPAALFDFSKEIIPSEYNGNDCGPIFFPENLRKSYKIKFNYRLLKENEKMNFACGPCTAMAMSFPWNAYHEVSLKNVVKLDN